MHDARESGTPVGSSSDPTSHGRLAKKIRWEGFAWGLVVAIGLIIWRHEVLFLPPYEDQAIGYWSEADYLAQHRFDYATFLFHEPNFMDEVPGRRAYAISILSPILALIQLAVPDTPTRLCLVHLIWFLITGSIAGQLAIALRPVTGRWGAMAASLALVTSPHFLVQTEIMGMDIPVAAAFLWSARRAAADRLFSALLISFLAFAFKVTGLVATLAILTYILVMMLLDPRPRGEGRPRYGRALTLGVLLLSIEIILELLFDTSVSALIGLRWFPVMRPRMALTTTPDIVIYAVLVALAAIGSLVWQVTRGLSLREFRVWVFDRRLWLMAWIVVAGFIAAVHTHAFVPRYIAPATPLLFLLLGWTLTCAARFRVAGTVALLGMATFHVLNADGRFFPPLNSETKAFISHWPAFDQRSCAFTERSREYLTDLRSTLALCNTLEKAYVKSPIVCAEPIATYLSYPALGYVSRPLSVHRVLTAGQTVEMLVALRASESNGPAPIVVAKRATRSLLPARQAEDEIIFEDRLDPPLIAYRWNSFEDVPNDLRRLLVWYVPTTRRKEEIELTRIDLLMRTGRIAFARAEIADWKKQFPDFKLLDELERKIDRTAKGEGTWDQIRRSWEK